MIFLLAIKCFNVAENPAYYEKTQNPDANPVQSNEARSGKENYEWIIDEDLLRDEAILFGLSGSEYEDKLNTIQQFYQHKIAVIETDQKALEKEKEEKRLAIESNEKHIISLKEKVELWSTNPDIDDHTFYRSLARLTLYSLILIFTYFLIIEWMGNRWENSILVSLGVFLFGSLSLFSEYSILYSPSTAKTEREKWKIILEEYGIPFVTSLFIIFWGDKQASIPETLFLALLIFSLFLFAGKGWLGSIERLRADYLVLKKNLNTNRFVKGKILDAKTEIRKREEFIEEGRRQIGFISDSLNARAQTIQSLRSEIEVKKNYFLSEFHLANATSENVSSEQLFRWGLNPKRDAHG